MFKGLKTRCSWRRKWQGQSVDDFFIFLWLQNTFWCLPNAFGFVRGPLLNCRGMYSVLHFVINPLYVHRGLVQVSLVCAPLWILIVKTTIENIMTDSLFLLCKRYTFSRAILDLWLALNMKREPVPLSPVRCGSRVHQRVHDKFFGDA